MTERHRPHGWRKIPLSAAVHIVRARENPQANPSLPFIGMDNVEAHTMRILGTVPASAMKSSAIRFKEGDVLYGRLRPYLNKVVAPSFDGLASAEFIPLTPVSGVATHFIAYRLNSADFVQFTSHLDEGDRPRVDWEGISDFQLWLPPQLEQKRIVEAIDNYLSRLDAAVASLERAQAKLKAYCASVLKAAVEGRLVPTEAELARAEKRDYEPANVLLNRILVDRRRRWEEAELKKLNAAGKAPKNDNWKAKYREPAIPATSGLPKLPEGWAWATLEQLCTEVTDGDHQPPPVSVDGVPFLVIGDVRTGQLDFTDCRRVPQEYYDKVDWKRRPDEDDILFTVVGSFGIPVRIIETQPFCVQRHIAILKAPPRGVKSYLFYALASAFVLRQATVAATGTAQKTLGLAPLRRLIVPIAPLPEMIRITAEMERLSSITARVEIAINDNSRRVSRLRQSVLKSAFEGKLVDQDPNDEPGDKLLKRVRAKRVDTVGTKTPRGVRTKAAL